jgi:hypothetical protein
VNLVIFIRKQRDRIIRTMNRSGFPHGVSPFISTAGTCWVTLALTLALQNVRRTDWDLVVRA